MGSLPAKEIQISGTTTAGGAATPSSGKWTGWVESIYLDISGLDATADITVSATNTLGESTNLLVVTDSQTDKKYYPRTLEHLDTDASNLTTHTRHLIVESTITVTVAQGGATKAFNVLVQLLI